MKFWNKLFYLTWKGQNYIGEVLFQRSIHYFIAAIFPAVRKNKMERDYKSVINDRNKGLNIGFAFQVMFLTTAIIYTILLFSVLFSLNLRLKENLIYILVTIVTLSYLTNYILLYKGDKYLKYFKEFDEQPVNKSLYLLATLLHLGVFSLFFYLLFVLRGVRL